MSGTAIAIVYCSDGFALAADGREMRDGQVLTDEAQKIFRLEDTRRILAYGLTGHSSLINDQTGAVCDLVAEAGSHGMLVMPWVFTMNSAQGPTAQNSCRGYLVRNS